MQQRQRTRNFFTDVIFRSRCEPAALDGVAVYDYLRPVYAEPIRSKLTLPEEEPREKMTVSEPNKIDRRGGTQEIVRKLLDERQEMLLMFCRVAGLEPFKDATPSVDVLQEFCQVLVDYSAFGHFEIYERIVAGRERRSQVVEVAREVYPRIAEATEVAVEFNDKYDASDHTLDLKQLDRDLGKLGEEIAVRIEMEDHIIQALTAR